MVHEEFVGSQFGGASGAAEGRPSGPTVLEPAIFARANPATATPTPARGQAEGAGHATIPATQPRLRPWQAAARAKGRPGYFLAKRCLDFVLALMAIVILSPVFLVIALLVRFTSRGPAFYRQERVGYAGRPFVMFKFRSMYIESDENLHRLAYEQFLRGERASGKVDGELLTAAHPSKGAAKAKRQPSGDPRVTRVGNVLRRTSLDELPQLFNVLRGDMSLVGPRPPIPYEVGLYEPRHLGRLDTLPGITGFWQVSGRGRVTFGRMIDMDLEYIQKQSFWYDVKWLLLTIPAVLSRKGAA
ncbi:MAG TPA: sugar transferase [Ktedonobacterales bacterium]|nr:sugar transferase [Ktedonobacterales bacterium]